jgi:transposase
MTATSLQNHPSVEELFNHVDTIPLALFEQLDFSFLTDFPVFAPTGRGRTREHEPPELLKGVLYCFSREIYSAEVIARELRDELLYLQCGFDSPPSHQSIRRFLTDIALVVEDVFGFLVDQVVARDQLDNTFRIDSTDVHEDSRDCEASWNYDPTAEADESDGDEKEQDEQGDGGYYFGYGCLVVTTSPKLPVAAAFTDQKQVDKETARRVTQDALAVSDPLWMLGDAAFDMLEWHDDLFQEGVVVTSRTSRESAA